jgi:DNA-binding HxlR family transcriptional regulator
MFGRKDDEEIKSLREQVEKLKEQINGLSKQLEPRKEEEQPEKAVEPKAEEPKTEQPTPPCSDARKFEFNPQFDFGDRLGEYIGGMVEGIMNNVMKDLDRTLGGLSQNIKPEDFTKNMTEKFAPKETAKSNPKAAADLMNALGHENRVAILGELVSGGCYASDLQAKIPDISASTLSSHLDVLEKAGLVVQEKARGRYLITMSGRLAYQMANEISKQAEQNSL